MADVHQILDSQAPQIWQWFKERGGIALWQSVNLSNPGRSWTTPRVDKNGKEPSKPSWEADQKPYRVITDPTEVEVIAPLEVRRFRVALRMGREGFMVKCTDASSAKIRRAVERAASRRADRQAWYEFDYGTQEAVIFVPAERPVPLATFMERHT